MIITINPSRDTAEAMRQWVRDSAARRLTVTRTTHLLECSAARTEIREQINPKTTNPKNKEQYSITSVRTDQLNNFICEIHEAGRTILHEAKAKLSSRV